MAKRMGRPAPVKEAPPLTIWQARVFEAFGALSTERQIGMEEGPIPWSSIVAYARHYDLDVEDLTYLVRRLDGAYLKFQRKKAKIHGGNTKGTGNTPSTPRPKYSRRRSGS